MPGVGDKLEIIAAPVMAACGAYAPMPMLGKVKALGNVEILDGGEEDAAEEESA